MNFLEEFRHDNPAKQGNTFSACIATGGNEWDDVPVSLFTIARRPTWEEMCWIKDRFWDQETPRYAAPSGPIGTGKQSSLGAAPMVA